MSLCGSVIKCGRIHPVIQVRREICAIFASFGFSVVEGPEIELDYYNFEALNIPKDHPQGTWQDTFYIEDNNSSAHTYLTGSSEDYGKNSTAAADFIARKVYRRDSDISHTPMFHQIEGLLVD